MRYWQSWLQGKPGHYVQSEWSPRPVSPRCAPSAGARGGQADVGAGWRAGGRLVARQHFPLVDRRAVQGVPSPLCRGSGMMCGYYLFPCRWTGRHHPGPGGVLHAHPVLHHPRHPERCAPGVLDLGSGVCVSWAETTFRVKAGRRDGGMVTRLSAVPSAAPLHSATLSLPRCWIRHSVTTRAAPCNVIRSRPAPCTVVLQSTLERRVRVYCIGKKKQRPHFCTFTRGKGGGSGGS